jgi:replicative DNA helicase
MVVIAGRPGMGKTSLALDIVRHVADRTRHCDYGHDVLMFSMEMTGAQLLMRLLGNLGSIKYHDLRTGKLDEREMGRIMPVIGQIESLNLAINDADNMTVMQIRAESRRHNRWLKTRGRKMTMIVVDYLQLVRGEGRDDGSENRAQVVAMITRGLKSLARELNVVVLALSQLNRAVEARTGGNRRPMLGDLRESGSIEQDADMILFLYRDYLYNSSADPTEAEIIIGKHRNGPTDKVKVSFQREFSSFRNRPADKAY